MISLRDVSFAISSGRAQVTILRNATVDLPSNERIAVLGLPGSGKSSIIRLIAGALQPQSGVIDRYARVSFPVGFSGGFRVKLTIRENIAHVARLYGSDVDEILDFVAAVADTTNMMHTKLGDISPQQRTRIAYALTYAIPFETYLIDNRVSVGDDVFRSRCEQMFEGRCAQAGIILATGHVRYARRYCNKVALLSNGQLILYEDFEQGCWEFERLSADSGMSITAAEA